MLISDTIKLRAIEPEDLELVYAWENNTEVWQVSNTYAPFSRFVLSKYLENAHQDIYEAKQLRLMIDLRGDTNGVILETIGSIDLFDFEPLHARAGIGVLINKKIFRNQGFAKSAVELVIEYGFNYLNLNQIYCNILPSNEASIALFTGIGFVECGRKKDWVRTLKGWEDEIIYQLMKP